MKLSFAPLAGFLALATVASAFSPNSKPNNRPVAIVENQVSKAPSSPLFRSTGASKLRMTDPFTNVIVPGFLMVTSVTLTILSQKRNQSVRDIILSLPEELQTIPSEEASAPIKTMEMEPLASTTPEITVVKPTDIEPIEVPATSSVEAPVMASVEVPTTTTTEGTALVEAQEAALPSRIQEDINDSQTTTRPMPLFVRLFVFLWRAIQKTLAPWRPWRNISA